MAERTHDVFPVGVQAPTPGRMVRVIGPGGFDKPAVVTQVYAEGGFFGPLVIDVLVLQGGGGAFGYLDSSDLANAIAGGTLPHKSTREANAVKRGVSINAIGPCYWIWPTETP